MTSRANTFRTLILAAGLASGLAAAPMLAQAQAAMPAPPVAMMPAPTTITLTATGTSSATPDMATISFGVLTQDKTASGAMKANNVRMNQVMAALKAAGIDDKDVQTSNLNLSPQYDYSNNQSPRLTGYQVQDQVSVRVNDLARTGPVIDAVIAAGVNQVDSIDFDLKNDGAATDTARTQAVATLMQRAQLYATAFGLKVKRVVTISEGGPAVQPPRPMMFAKAVAGYNDTSTPVASGQMQLSVDVTATFELGN